MLTLDAQVHAYEHNHPGRQWVGTLYGPAEVTTLAGSLKKEGFRTAAFVSAAVLEKHYGLDQGFDVYNDDLSAGRERHPRMVADRPAGAELDPGDRHGWRRRAADR